MSMLTIRAWNRYVALREASEKQHVEFTAANEPQSWKKRAVSTRGLTATEEYELKWLEAANSTESARKEFVEHMLLMVLPPLLLLLFGFSVGWVAKGFKSAS